jgi:D-glycero-alpha-D-manno-heptose-7-phosphate kinase
MSFVGGGSDLPAYYRKFGGAVLSTSIDKYVYVTVNKKFDNGIRVAYSKNEEVESVEDVEHNLVRNTLNLLNIKGGIEITSVADIPSKGSGLGSSSSFTVGLLNVLHAYNNKFISKKLLAELSCKVEIDICAEPIGKQDQFAAAFGGLNLYKFNEDDSVEVMPIITNKKTIDLIEKNIIVFYTGITRSASSILAEQSKLMDSDKNKQNILKEMVNLTFDLYNDLQKDNISNFGKILHESWNLKKSITTQISNNFIDDIYNLGILAGAEGGKLLGAGNGGFIMFYAPSDKHEDIRKRLSSYKEVRISFEKEGSKIIYYE